MFTGDGVEPSVYILDLYTDCFDLTITQNGEEIIDKLQIDECSHSGTELTFTAIQVTSYHIFFLIRCVLVLTYILGNIICGSRSNRHLSIY